MDRILAMGVDRHDDEEDSGWEQVPAQRPPLWSDGNSFGNAEEDDFDEFDESYFDDDFDDDFEEDLDED